MSTLDKFSKEQIRKIAGEVDEGSFTCHINGETGEVVFLMGDELLEHSGGRLDEDGEMSSDDDLADWQEEALAEYKADKAKVDSWGDEHTILIEKPTSRDDFKVMQAFVEKCVPEGRVKEDLEEVLLRSKPFRNFSAIVENSKFREAWFDFKQEALEDYVRERISEYDGEEEEYDVEDEES